MSGTSALSKQFSSEPAIISLNGVELVLLPEGAMWWPDERLLVVSDLHFEKGSAYAVRGQLLPPYDTSATLCEVESLVTALQPECVVSLGDSFHDGDAEARLCEHDRSRIRALTAATEWFWVEGNHDPNPPASLGGRGARELAIGGLVFRHEPVGGVGEVAGHLHPAAKVRARGRAVRRRCFAVAQQHMVMPAFGAYTGGLNICDPAFVDLFHGLPSAFVLGERRVFLLDSERLIADACRPNGLWSL